MVEMGRLIGQMRPPEAGGDSVDWEHWERRLGFAFPSDYKSFMSRYGGGLIDGEFVVMSLAGDGGAWLEENENSVAMFDADCGPGTYASDYPSHFGRDGLVCWAVNSGSEFCYWYAVSDDPDEWPVVVFSPGQEMWMRYDGCMVDFLCALFAREISFPFTMEFPKTSSPDFLAERDQQFLKEAGVKWWRYRSYPGEVVRQMQAAGIEPTHFFPSAAQHTETHQSRDVPPAS